MIAPEPMDAERAHTSHVIAGFLAAAAIFAGLTALVAYPGRMGPAAVVFALIAVGLGGGSNRRLTALGMAAAIGGFFFGMVIAVFLDRPIF